MKTNILITAVNAAPGRSVYNSLKKNKNLKITIVDSDTNSVFNFLEDKDFYNCPKANKKGYKKFINNLIKNKKIKIIIPCIEPEIIFFSKNKKYYEKKKINILIPEISAINKVVNKFSLYTHCKKIGIKTPKSEKITFPVKKKHLNIKYPLIIKPIIGWGMNNISIVKNKKEFNKISKNLKGRFLIQKYLGNYKKNIYAVGILIDKQNKERMSFVSKSILTKYKNGGPAHAGIEVKNQYLLNTVKKLIGSINGFCGPAMVEFIKLRGKNNYYLIDFNPRIWGYSQLAYFNGKNFSQAIVDIILNNKIKQNYKSSMKYMMLRDFIDLKILN